MHARKNLLDLYVHVDWDWFDGKYVLDIGPAYGIWSMRAVEAGARVDAVEISPYWCKTYTDILAHHGIKADVTQANILEFEPGKTYDAVLFMAVWHHVPDYQSALRRVFSLSRDRVYLEGPIRDKTISTKHKTFGAAEEQAWYWEPTEDELVTQILNNGGSILSTHYNSNRRRISLITCK
jgi:2-polyprenyl-3-methyl-5-hydroxy-6-metoxy-1,4-benzoquinol methylase